jgi:hypothetical protein
MREQRLRAYVALAAMLAVAPEAAAESLVDKLLRISGLTASPAQMRDSDAVGAGDIWIADLDRHTTRALTIGGGYRSPIFSPAAGSLHALNGDTIFRISREDGTAVAVQTVAGVVKLVGFDANDADEIVVLLAAGIDGSSLAAVSLKSRRITPLPYDADSKAEQRILEQIRGQDRVYGDTIIYVQTETRQGLARSIEWTDVYVRRGARAPQNVSVCNGVRCGQPALSSDGRSLTFVKVQ